MSNLSFEELAALHAVAKALAQPWDLRDQLEQVLGEMSARLGMQRGMISILDRDSGEALLEVAHGVDL
ncbi:MAG TPA: AAA family ATPase, partial [Syntrophales bacterium]|nr:AAA family ATPase [Syntrophales bacterium]